MMRPHDHLRLIALSVIALLGIGGLVTLWQTGWLHEERIGALLEPFGYWGFPLFVLMFALLIMLWVPLTVLVLAAVTILNPFLALVLSTLALALGATGSYYVARGIGREPIERLLSTRANVATWVAGGFARRAFASVVLMRAVGVPNNIASYLCGVVGVRWRTFVAACIAGEFTGMATTAFLGNSLLDVLRTDDLSAVFSVHTMLGIASGTCTLVLIWWAQRVVRRQSAALRASMPEDMFSFWGSTSDDPEGEPFDVWFAEDDLPGHGITEVREHRDEQARAAAVSDADSSPPQAAD